MKTQTRKLKTGYTLVDINEFGKETASEEVEIPLRIASALDLFYDLQILGKGRGKVRVRNVATRNRKDDYYEVFIPDVGILFTIVAYANQALMLTDSSYQKKQPFDTEGFKQRKIAKAKSLFSKYKKKMTARTVGAWLIYDQILGDSKNEEYLLQLAFSNVTIPTGIQMAKQDIPPEHFKDMEDMPDSWLQNLLGDD